MQLLPGWAFDGAARVVELNHRRIAPDGGGSVLLLATNCHHLFIRKSRIRTTARTARAVGASHATEPLIVAGKAVEDAVKCHELEIVLMRPDAEMSDTGERVNEWFAIWNIDFRRRLMQLHGVII